MLPILRILPVGGVFLAILLLILALKTPGDRPLPPDMISARGPLLDLNEHPEWRQDWMQAAVRRADELTRLRDLTDTAPSASSSSSAETPASAVPAATPAPEASESKVAALPNGRGDSDPDNDIVTGSIEDTATATIPVEIGAASTFELPIVLPPERPAVIRTREDVKPQSDNRRKHIKRVSRAKPAPASKPAVQLNLFELLFGGSALSAGNSPAATAGINLRPDLF